MVIGCGESKAAEKPFLTLVTFSKILHLTTPTKMFFSHFL